MRLYALLVIFYFLSVNKSPVDGQFPEIVDPQPGEIFVTPRFDLDLQPVSLQVPDQFAEDALSDRHIFLPPGFVVKVFAAGDPLFGPRFMAWSPDGVLHVANMKVGGTQWTPKVNTSQPPPVESRLAQVIAMPDRNRDGVADELRVVADQFWFPNSIQFYDEWLYVADMHEVVRLRDVDGDGLYEEREVVVPNLPIGHHRTRTIQMDPARNKFFLSIGSSCDLCREIDPRRATIMEFNMDGSGERIFATGLRNAVGLDVHPETGQLWATFNGHDRSSPPERIDIIREGGFYGWPLAHGFRTWVDFPGQASYRNEIFPLNAADSALVETLERPIAQAGARLAPMGIHFYRGKIFPEPFRSAGFVAFRGGSNALVPGFRVMMLQSTPNGNEARLADFMTGFQEDPSNLSSIWGKPVGLTTDTLGRLYVSSDWINHFILLIEMERLRGVWEGILPDNVLTGGRLDLDITVRVDVRIEGLPVQVVADLRPFGGPQDWPLDSLGENTFRLRRSLDIGDATGSRAIEITLSQQLDGERIETRLRQFLQVLPGRDLFIAEEDISPNWKVIEDDVVRWVGPSMAAEEFSGMALALEASNVNFAGWNLALEPKQAIHTMGYTHVRFAFHPGDTGKTRGARMNLLIKPGRNVNLLDEGGIDLARAEWQEVTLPIEALDLTGPIERILFQSNIEGRFYMDEMRLVTATPLPTDTAVRSVESTPVTSFLEQNFPNPFNAGTVIRYQTANDGHVDVHVYDLLGQHVATLKSGWMPAGNHVVTWDGRGIDGHTIASGVYIYRLVTRQGAETRKLLMLR